jgi:hypothetical protein
MAAQVREYTNPDEFTSQVTVDSITYPFFEIEDGGGYIGHGHQDTREFADALTEYWTETHTESDYDDPRELVEHTYGVVLVEEDGYWYLETELDGVEVTEATPHSIPLTVVFV